MTSSAVYNTPAPVIAVILFAGIILCYLAGIRLLRYRKKKNPEYEAGGMGALEGGLLGLLSLLLAFTFNKAASNYDTRRAMLVQEANDIGTALYRSDLYPDSIRSEFRNDFKEYIAARIAYYEAGNDENKIRASLDNAENISLRIWKRAAGNNLPGETTRSMQMIPAINSMMDAMNHREAARVEVVPESILWLLFVLCLAGSFIIGYSSKSKKADWVIVGAYALMTVMTIYLILDLDRPGRGIITTRLAHQYMDHLPDSFDPGSK